METDNQNVTHLRVAADRVLAGMRRVYALKRELDAATRELQEAVSIVQRVESGHD